MGVKERRGDGGQRTGSPLKCHGGKVDDEAVLMRRGGRLPRCTAHGRSIRLSPLYNWPHRSGCVCLTLRPPMTPEKRALAG
jgi:hypothetical protein